MTPPLRRAHRIIWLLLAITLPVGFVAALRAVQPPPVQPPVAALPPARLPVLLRSVKTDSLVVSLRRATRGTEQQLEVIVRQPVEVAASVQVRQSESWRTLGSLNAPDTYRFALPISNAHPTVRIVDDLHQRTLRTIQF